MKSNKRYTIVIIIILLLFNILAIINYYRISHENSKLKENLIIEPKKSEIDDLFLDHLYKYTLNKKYITENIKNDSLISFIRGNETLIFYYNFDACGTCINEIYADLNMIIDKLPVKTAILEGNVTELKNHRVRNEHVQIPRYTVKEKPFENISLIVVNPNLEIRTYYNYEFNRQYKNKFFENVLPKYFKN